MQAEPVFKGGAVAPPSLPVYEINPVLLGSAEAVGVVVPVRVCSAEHVSAAGERVSAEFSNVGVEYTSTAVSWNGFVALQTQSEGTCCGMIRL